MKALKLTTLASALVLLGSPVSLSISTFRCAGGAGGGAYRRGYTR